MSKKNKKKVSMKSSILLLLLMAILLISSTYAWFTANKTVKISTLDVNVAAKNGLQISSDGTSWKTILSLADINPDTLTTYTTNKNQIPTMMEPVSTVGEINVADGTMKMYYGSVDPDRDGDYALTSTVETDAKGAGENAGKYIAFDIFLKVVTTTNLTLTPNSKVVYKGTTDKGLQNAARVAFCVEGTAAAGSDLADIQGLKGAKSHGGLDSTTYIWEPNIDVHTAGAKANAQSYYGIENLALTGAARVNYWGIKAAFSDPVKLEDTNGGTAEADKFTEVTPDYTTTAAQDTAINIFTLDPGITKVRVYMWIEGQDVDCENGASGADISYTIEFTAD